MSYKRWWDEIVTAVGIAAAPYHAVTDTPAPGGNPQGTLRAILSAYREVHGAESRDARAELEQLQALLSDAVARLTSSFAEMASLAGRQRQIALDMARGQHLERCACVSAAANDSPDAGDEPIRISPTNAGSPVDLGEVTRGIERTVHEAVTALQFQDIASQLVGHTAARLEALERMAGALACLPEASPDQLGEALATARGAWRSSAVSQQRLNEGSAELF
jgi:hypothetical protein